MVHYTCFPGCRALVALVLLAGMLAGGCEKSSPRQATPAAARGGTTGTASRSGRDHVSISPYECEAFGQLFVRAVYENEPVEICRLIDYRQLVQIAAQGTNASWITCRQFARELK